MRNIENEFVEFVNAFCETCIAWNWTNFLSVYRFQVVEIHTIEILRIQPNILGKFWEFLLFKF